ncbi:transposase [Ahrensia sp. R2A130]|uniref:transposase n=1 Tax=Ahrensia sp. R2A130 TaxID=744979 RepID=UPI00200031E1|nr:transposase [Ahrensia sp. R2A130]
MSVYLNWRWHLDEVFVRINGETHYLWRAVEVLVSSRLRPQQLQSATSSHQSPSFQIEPRCCFG